ncbi:MAG TPA: phosphatidate cytidylyltransferase [Alphaproteobacteria bacterium]
MDAAGQKPISLNFRNRLLSGLVLGPLVLALILLGGWYFMTMVMVAAAISFHEWYGLVKDGKDHYRHIAIGAVYIIICYVSFVFLRLGFDAGGWLTLSLIVCVWASDVGAYFTGKRIGGKKLAPKISPNKTWAGFGGAMFFFGLTGIVMVGLGDYMPSSIPADIGLEPRHVWGVFFAGALMGAVAQAGDLFISVYKRRANMKDTGVLIPGHGGLLDRIDSLMLCAPVFFLIVSLWMA